MNERKKNILIIAEGYEEKPYMDKILSFPNINKEVYLFVPVVNVKGNGNIVERYQFEIQRGYYDIILIFCDADKGSEQFLSIVERIGYHFFNNPRDGIQTFIFANPVTLQIILSHFGDASLDKVSKNKNASIVKELTGIENYNASQEQIKNIVDKIHFNSLDVFKVRLGKLSTDYNDVPSTNFLIFLQRFESSNSDWIDDINKLRK